MKILFDSSVLIAAHLKEIAAHKTGIFRYTENLACQLKKLSDIDLTFYSSLSRDEERHWQTKLLEIAHLNTIPLLNVYHPMKNQIDTLSSKIKRSSTFKKFMLKGYRESLRFIHNSLQKDISDFDSYDLFYSPYHPLPKINFEKEIPSFITIHDLIPLKYPQFFSINKRHFFDRIFKNAKPWHYFFAVSESTKADICHYYSIPSEKIFVKYNASSSDIFYPVKNEFEIERVAQKYQLPNPYILSLATLEPRKNISFLIDSFIQLIEQQPSIDLDLVLCGSKGWGFESLLKKIKPYMDRIHFIGFVEDQDLAALYTKAVAFAYPSIYEGFGLPPLEAMSCGTPVIVSERSSLPEVVGKAGLYIDPLNQDDLAQRIFEIYKNDKFREELQCQSLIQAKKFSWEKSAEIARKAFKTVLK